MTESGSFCRSKIFGISVVLVLLASALARAEAAEGGSPVSYEFKTITYNVCGLPDLFTYDRNLAPMNKRFKYAGGKLRSYDIIGLQEAFVSKRSIIETELGDFYVAHGTDIGMAQKMGSGVYTFTRWPIKKIYYERWRQTEGPDALSHKGFVMVTTHLSDDLAIDVYNLHAQAGGRHDYGVDNMDQLVEAMNRMSFGQNRPILLIGDFNCRFWDNQCSRFVETSGVETVFKEQSGVDHMFYHENGSGWKISVVGYRTVFQEKMNGMLVSDHDGFETIFRFEKE